jgi:hypothetical protein
MQRTGELVESSQHEESWLPCFLKTETETGDVPFVDIGLITEVFSFSTSFAAEFTSKPGPELFVTSF